MPSTFTWLDYSEHDRRKMADAISAFREQDTRDELGIGSVRDGFADIFFPGTSTIQTRARYFLFVPWMYLDLERKKIPSAKAAQWARNRETGLISGLEKSGDKKGVIGREAHEKLKRLPSNIYWQGLRAWGIRQFGGAQDRYHSSLDRHYTARSRTLRSDDDDMAMDSAASNWHSGLPAPPDGFPGEASFSLRAEDSEYLKGRILCRAASSLLAHLIRQKSPPADTAFIWESEACGGFPDGIRRRADHARCFSETIHGAALLYNLMLAELARREEAVAKYRDSIALWAGTMESRCGALSRWDRAEFWCLLDGSGARVPGRTREFVTQWLDRVLTMPKLGGLAEDRPIRTLIRNRERQLKRAQARLDNPRALELWNGAAGTGRLDYRWGVSKTLLTDILEGLGHA